jgi:hypothetical protein
MGRLRKLDLARIQITPVESRKGRWDFANRPVSGYLHRFDAIDGNFATRNRWRFVVRVPSGNAGYIQVQPEVHPSRAVLKNIERRVVSFQRATASAHRGKYYCKLALSDLAGRHTKRIAKRGERSDLPRWFEPMRHRMRLKATVRKTKGTDPRQQVLLVRSGDYARMVRVFVALKAWPLLEDRGLA